MKRFLTALVTTLLLSAALCVTASASDFDAVAEDLSKIGMFQGTASGFELDRAPTRSEAAIMLVRLYGAEEEAKAAYGAGEIKHPFTDVSAFTSPYVAWLYTNGITNGYTATTYASSKPCTLQNYAVFLLRALGYQDNVDFQYGDALTFAQSQGFYTPVMFSGPFLRDDLSALTYQALAADTADGETYLLNSLIESGAIDARAAEPMTKKIETYRAMQAVMAQMDAKSMDLGINLNMDMDISAAGQSLGSTSTAASGNMQIIADDITDIQMAYTMTTAVDGETLNIGMWMKDGWAYMSMTADGETQQFKYPLEDQLAMLEQLNLADPAAMNVSGLAMIDSLTAQKSGGGTVYTMVIGKSMAGLMDGLSSMMGEDAAPGMDLGDITAAYTIGSNGKLKSVSMVFSAAVTMEIPLEDGQTAPMTMAYDYDMTMKINATGKHVKVTYPSFKNFVEVAPDQAPSLTA